MSFGVKNDGRFDSVKISENTTTDSITGVLFNTLPLINSGTTIVISNDSQSISASQLVNGYVYIGTAGPIPEFPDTLTLPTAALVQTYLATLGITSASGLRFPDIAIYANSINVTGAVGTTVIGTTLINNKSAICKVIFTGVDTIDVVVTVSA